MINSIQSTAEEAWRVYNSRGKIAANLLRDHVYRAWERAHIQQANPQHMKAERLSKNETADLIQRHFVLIEAARPYMHALSLAAGVESHAAILGNEQAMVLEVTGCRVSHRKIG